jgi:hypothetical protein
VDIKFLHDRRGLELHVMEMHKYDVDQVARMADALKTIASATEIGEAATSEAANSGAGGS